MLTGPDLRSITAVLTRASFCLTLSTFCRTAPILNTEKSCNLHQRLPAISTMLKVKLRHLNLLEGELNAASEDALRVRTGIRIDVLHDFP